MPIPPDYAHKLSVLVVDSASSKTIYAYNENQPRLIASNMKLFTTVFGLQHLGPSFQWHTKLFYSGQISHGHLQGNLYVKGGGDPTLTRNELHNMFSQLNKLGIKQIQGNLIVDESIFNAKPVYSMLNNDAYDSDTVLPSGLIIDQNLTQFKLQRQHNQFTLQHNLVDYTVVSKLTVNPQLVQCSGLNNLIHLTLNHSRIVVQGKIAKSCTGKVLTYNLLPNFSYNHMLIRHILNHMSITVNGKYSLGKVPLTAHLIVDHASSPLSHVLIPMNQYSNNLTAETVLLSVGAYTTTNTNTYANSQKLFDQFLVTNDLLNPQFNLENGAGLSRHEYFSVTEIIRLLKLVDKSPLQLTVAATLPKPGEAGTLHDTFLPFTGRLLAKTGSLSDTKAYSGYFYARSGHKYLISIVINQINAEDKRQIHHFNRWVMRLLTQLDMPH
jgi:D-alanyl-D-alanine carboxypeptidase/D-alanyl-D-alanine-endopeptidase (penicillin-binding protein 4)